MFCRLLESKKKKEKRNSLRYIIKCGKCNEYPPKGFIPQPERLLNDNSGHELKHIVGIQCWTHTLLYTFQHEHSLSVKWTCIKCNTKSIHFLRFCFFFLVILPIYFWNIYWFSLISKSYLDILVFYLC